MNFIETKTSGILINLSIYVAHDEKIDIQGKISKICTQLLKISRGYEAFFLKRDGLVKNTRIQMLINESLK